MRTNLSKKVSKNTNRKFSLPKGATGGIMFFPVERWEIPRMKYAKPMNYRCQYCQARCSGILAEAACMLNALMWLHIDTQPRFTVRQYEQVERWMNK